MTKHSGALVLPALVLVAICEAVATRKIARLAGALAVIAVASYAILWGFYGFRYASRPGGLTVVPPLDGYLGALHSAAERGIIGFFAKYHLFPESYLYGWADILQIPGSRTAFLFGKVYPTGQWFFFPAVFLIKTTIALLALLLLLAFAGIEERRRELLFLFVPAALFAVVAVVSDLNLGVRHILPIYPLCIVGCAAAAWQMGRRSRGAAIAIAALIVFGIASSARAYPNYLAYSNEAFGGPSNTYRIVSDSNVDWGQGLKWVKAYLDRNKITDCWFAYPSPMIDPAYYGVRCKPLVTSLGRMAAVPQVPPKISGTILISATELSGMLWGPGALNPYEVFRQRRPDDNIGNVTLVYRGTFDVPLMAAQGQVAAAWALLRQKKFPEALAMAQSAVRLAPDSAEVNATLGMILRQMGRNDDARPVMMTALELARKICPEYQTDLIRAIEHPN